MRPITAIALFCEDIREEKSGMDTLVGILPDNVAISGPHGIFPKLAVYLRMQIDDEFNARTVKARVIFPDGREIEMSPFEPAFIETAREDSKAKGLPYTGFVGKAVMSPVPIEALGKIEVIVTANDQDFVCGVLNLVIDPAAPSES